MPLWSKDAPKSMVANYRRKLARVFFLFFIVALAGCIPMIRTEYIAPKWTGQIINIQSLKAMKQLTLVDSTSNNKGTVDKSGKFVVLGESQSFDFKLPAASAMKYFTLELDLSGEKLLFARKAPITSVEPLEFDLKTVFIIWPNSSPFLVKTIANEQHQKMSKKFIEECKYLKSAVTLTESLRLMNQPLFENKVRATFTFSLDDMVKNQKKWAIELWEAAFEMCFKNKYENRRKLRGFYNPIFDELRSF
ncbi:hypothetical protein [Pleionea sediminis]|uniref:hypothetical protein n=1 Tax=Pleionea sediminis TaxID=2569479 RepID=UPI00118670F6|nr:hypothetical protein [Pleionea sediminis]